jgi:hypothetical protein
VEQEQLMLVQVMNEHGQPVLTVAVAMTVHRIA